MAREVARLATRAKGRFIDGMIALRKSADAHFGDIGPRHFFMRACRADIASGRKDARAFAFRKRGQPLHASRFHIRHIARARFFTMSI